MFDINIDLNKLYVFILQLFVYTKGKMLESNTNKLGIIKRTEILLILMNDGNLESISKNLSALQMQQLRDFLENEVLFLSSLKDKKPLELAKIRDHYELIPNYFRLQGCFEPLDACYNETCRTSNPGCFSKKMLGQISATLVILKKYLPMFTKNKEKHEVKG
jgi:hypothetical protein